jgi:hypothetical protein
MLGHGGSAVRGEYLFIVLTIKAPRSKRENHKYSEKTNINLPCDETY